MARHQMSDDELITQLDVLERQAVGYYGGEIAGEQSKAMDYYLSKPFGTEEEGRSRVVSSDVWDVVEGMTPAVMRPFVSSDDVVRFNPQGPEDEEAAQQESDYINYIVTQKSDVFNELVAAVKTGLLQKNAVAKYWWDETTSVEIERYDGLSDDVFAAIIQDDSVEVVEHTESQTEGIGPDGQPVVEVAHDVVLRIRKTEGQAKYTVIPPEEFRISRDALSTNPKNARYVAHVVKKTLSEIREMGFDVADDVADYNSQDPYLSPQYLARRRSEETNLYGLSETIDPSMREVTFRDVLVRVDFDGDGKAELRRVVMVGRDILLNEEAEEVNYVSWTPYPQPFKFYGRCPADETLEIQLIKSTLWRQSLDNIYTINNNRTYVGNKVNLDDMLDNQIAGLVRVDADVVGNQAMSMPVTPIGGVVQPMMEYLDAAKENRTGFSRYNQGSADLQNQKTLGEIQIVSEQSGMRIELISRAFAEQFLKPLMLGLHGLCRRHAVKKDVIRLRGKWVEVDPREWKTRQDMTVSVGLGNADKRTQFQGIQLIRTAQGELMQAGLVKPENLYASAAKLTELIGEKAPEKYFSDPSKAEQPKPPDPTESPEFMLKVAEFKRKDRELEIREREVDIKERDSQIAGLVEHGKLEAELAAMVPGDQVLMQIQRLEAQLAALQAKGTQEALSDVEQPEMAEANGQV